MKPRLVSTNYGASVDRQARFMLWLTGVGDRLAAAIELAVAQLAMVALWGLSAYAGLIALELVKVEPTTALLVGLWIGFTTLLWLGAIRRCRLRARREMQPAITWRDMGDHDEVA
jgi:hypothetical protein